MMKQDLVPSAQQLCLVEKWGITVRVQDSGQVPWRKHLGIRHGLRPEGRRGCNKSGRERTGPAH